jgi:prolyl-tRNA editing enzyme YbaK/EbsC (Cys-tRNA(Pro) deacylase)
VIRMDSADAKAYQVDGTTCGDFQRSFLTEFKLEEKEGANQTSVKFKGGQWATRPLGSPGTGDSGLGPLLDDALHTAEDPTTEALLEFARSWGPLAKREGECEEALESYRELCEKAEVFLRNYAHVTHGFLPPQKIWEKLEGLITKEKVLDVEFSPSPEVDFTDWPNPLGSYMGLLHELMTWWMKKSSVRIGETGLRPTSFEGEYRLEASQRFESEGCEGAVDLDLFRLLWRRSSIFECDRCRRIYVRDFRRPNENARNFCPSCNEGYRTTQKLSFRRWKEKKLMEEAFAEEGIPFELKEVEARFKDFLSEWVSGLADFREMSVCEVSLWKGGDRELYLVGVEKTGSLKAEKLSKTLCKPVKKVDEEEVEKLFPGRDFGLPAFPMAKRRQYPLLLDRKLLRREKVVFPTGFRNAFLILWAKDLERSSRVKIVDLQC